MSTSATSKKQPKTAARATRKTVLVYLVLSVVAVAVDNIYAIFGHGVRSDYMSLMLLYPLLGGAVVYFLVGLLTWNSYATSRMYRLGYNLYNSGVATLTVGSFYKGILEIAGTASDLESAFMIVGWAFAAIGMIFIIVAVATLRIRHTAHKTMKGLGSDEE